MTAGQLRPIVGLDMSKPIRVRLDLERSKQVRLLIQDAKKATGNNYSAPLVVAMAIGVGLPEIRTKLVGGEK